MRRRPVLALTSILVLVTCTSPAQRQNSLFQWEVAGEQPYGLLGHAVSSGGDFDGDGHDDVAGSALFHDGVRANEGRVFVFSGRPEGPSRSPGWRSPPTRQKSSGLGVSVGLAGDVDADGYVDLVVGADLFDGGHRDEGRVELFRGSPDGLEAEPSSFMEIGQSHAGFGFAVAGAGDVNGDGFDDVIVGAPLFDTDKVDAGRAFVYLGSANGLSTSAAWVAQGDQAYARFGRAVAAAGDVNGDGFSDVLIGAPAYDDMQVDEGHAFLYLGSPDGPERSPAWRSEAQQGSALFGWAVAGAGDVDGDGFDDVMIGAPNFRDGEAGEGRVFVFTGSAAGLSREAAWQVECDQEEARFGWAIAAAGDSNGDGFDDIVVGARGYDHGEMDEGAAFVYLGSAEGPRPEPALVLEVNQAGAQLGHAVAGGDVNGDGLGDIILGAPRFSEDGTPRGGIFVRLGSRPPRAVP